MGSSDVCLSKVLKEKIKLVSWMCWCGLVPREPDSKPNYKYIHVQIFQMTDSLSPLTQNI